MTAARLTEEQRDVLLRPLNPRRVAKMRAPGGNTLSHLEAWDVRAHLIRIFGFGGWDETDSGLGTVMLYEREVTSTGKTRWTVAYRATRKLTVRDAWGDLLCEYEATAVGEAANQPSRGDAHDMAIKTAESQALKRCAINLGTQFGLSLYDEGTTEDVVRATLVGGTPQEPVLSDGKGPLGDGDDLATLGSWGGGSDYE